MNKYERRERARVMRALKRYGLPLAVRAAIAPVVPAGAGQMAIGLLAMGVLRFIKARKAKGKK